MSLSTITKELLVGKWVEKYIEQYLNQDFASTNKKIIMKIEYIPNEFIPSILDVLSQLHNINDFKLTVKTIENFEGYENLKCAQHETTVWLRNNIQEMQAVILVLSKTLPEGQSLKDIISIDESVLLSSVGIEALQEALANLDDVPNYAIIEDLIKFIEFYQTVVDLHLYSLVDYITEVLLGDKMIGQALGEALPKLRLFKEYDLKVNNKSNLQKIVRKNYLLSTLRSKANKLLPKDKLLDSTTNFIQSQRDEGYTSEIWKVFNSEEELLKAAEGFIYHEDLRLLNLYSSDVEQLFNYKESKSFTDVLNNFREDALQKIDSAINEADTQEEIDQLRIEKMEAEIELNSGIDAILNGENPEVIQNVIDTYEDELDQAGVLKRVKNIVTKLNNPDLYLDFVEAILMETLVLVESIENVDFGGEYNFRLVNENPSLTSHYARHINFHLNLLEKSIHKLFIQPVRGEDNEADLPEELKFILQLFDGENLLKETSFKIDVNNLKDDVNGFYDFIQMLDQNATIGSVIVNDNKRTDDDIHAHICTQREKLKILSDDFTEDFNIFETFLRDYSQFIKKIEQKQIANPIDILEYLLNNLFISINAAPYKVIRDVYSFLDYIGVTRYLNTQEGVYRKDFSLLHPIRLIGYLSRMTRLNLLVNEFINTDYQENRLIQVSDMKQYKEYLNSYLGTVPPAYVVNEKDEKIFFLEDEFFGQGVYILESDSIQANEQMDSFTNEIQKVVKDYINVYPYASNTLNVLFMYVNNTEYIKRAIDDILKKQLVRKLNITLYSENNSAKIHRDLNYWITSREDLSTPILTLGGLPRVEINVISQADREHLKNRIKSTLTDFDIAIFMNFITKANSNNKKNFIETELSACSLESPEWVIFDEVGYLSLQGGNKHINYVSKVLPEVLKNYLNLQYAMHHTTVIDNSKVRILRGIISPGATQANKLYDELHDLFNWVVAYDKYIDKLLVQELSPKAQIIKYSIIRRANRDMRLLVSSAESLNKLIRTQNDTNYQDRLNSRLIELLKIGEIKPAVVQNILKTMKSISGSLLLKSLGAGRFIHELLAMYLTLKADNSKDNVITIWASCDDLEWFKSRQKRPDLLKIEIIPDAELKKFDIHFTLIELKLVHQTSYAAEYTDALKQLDSGMQILESYLNYDEHDIDKAIRLQSFYRYLMEARPYTNDELLYMEWLHQGTSWDIKQYYHKQADIYIYSHDMNFSEKENVSTGHYRTVTNDDNIHNFFTRSYVLQSLQIEEENSAEVVEALEYEDIIDHVYNLNDSLHLELEKEIDNDDRIKKVKEETSKEVTFEDPEKGIDDGVKTPNNEVNINDGSDNITEVAADLISQYATFIGITDSDLDINNVEITKDPKNEEYIEIEIFRQYPVKKHNVANPDFVKTESENLKSNIEQFYKRNGIKLSVQEIIIGSNIYRFICKKDINEKASSIINKGIDLQLWLTVDEAPSFFTKGRLMIDINRETPDVIYFDDFMKLVRQQFNPEALNDSVKIPVGLSPLNEVMYIDLDETPHILVAGTSGSGKSVSLNAMILSLMSLYSDENLKFVFIDPKQVEFSIYENTRHSKKLVTEIEASVEYLEELTELMEQRYSMMSSINAKNIKRYNKKIVENNLEHEPFEQIIIVFDEFADFMQHTDKDLVNRMQAAVLRIAQKARAAGIHLIICTQTPKADIINTNIRNNLQCRLCLKVADANASNVVLDEAGAERLAGKGDYLLKLNSDLNRGKSPYLDDDTFEAFIEFFVK